MNQGKVIPGIARLQKVEEEIIKRKIEEQKRWEHDVSRTKDELGRYGAKLLDGRELDEVGEKPPNFRLTFDLMTGEKAKQYILTIKSVYRQWKNKPDDMRGSIELPVEVESPSGLVGMEDRNVTMKQNLVFHRKVLEKIMDKHHRGNVKPAEGMEIDMYPQKLSDECVFALTYLAALKQMKNPPIMEAKKSKVLIERDYRIKITEDMIGGFTEEEKIIIKGMVLNVPISVVNTENKPEVFVLSSYPLYRYCKTADNITRITDTSDDTVQTLYIRTMKVNRRETTKVEK